MLPVLCHPRMMALRAPPPSWFIYTNHGYTNHGAMARSILTACLRPRLRQSWVSDRPVCAQNWYQTVWLVRFESTNSGTRGANLLRDLVGELGEVVIETPGQHPSLCIIGLAIGPGVSWS